MIMGGSRDFLTLAMELALMIHLLKKKINKKTIPKKNSSSRERCFIFYKFVAFFTVTFGIILLWESNGAK